MVLVSEPRLSASKDDVVQIKNIADPIFKGGIYEIIPWNIKKQWGKNNSV